MLERVGAALESDDIEIVTGWGKPGWGRKPG